MSSIHTRRAAIGAAVALTLGAGGFEVASANQPAEPFGVFTSIVPCRLVDTRPDFSIGGRTAPLGPDETFQLQGTGDNGECSGIPPDAIGLSLNVTAVGATLPTNLRLWPEGPVPNASSLNPVPGQPPTPNAVTVDLANDGSFRAYNLQGSVHLIVDVVGLYRDHEHGNGDVVEHEHDHRHDGRYYTKDQSDERYYSMSAVDSAIADHGHDDTYYTREEIDTRFAQLESDLSAANDRIAALEATLVGVSRAGDELTFSGMNVSIVNGTGTTDGDPNALGNLVIGYNEVDPVQNADAAHRGSHNLVIGTAHTYSSFGGIVAGVRNTITGDFASVTGGTRNVASDVATSVSGGRRNTASNFGASVLGGSDNVASAQISSVSGGLENSTSGEFASVSGGRQNSAVGDFASVTGGFANEATATNSTVSGGSLNNATGERSAVSGGYDNTAEAQRSSISGGRLNRVMSQATYGSITGGRSNQVGSGLNIEGGRYGSITGGDFHIVFSDYGTITGGHSNTVSSGSHHATVLGGANEQLRNTYDSLIGDGNQFPDQD